MSNASTKCPGCGLEMPGGAPPAQSYFNVSNECWSLFLEVMQREYQDAVLFGRVHQLSVDTYAVQHAGGPHPQKSVDVHLVGLHLALELGVPTVDIARRMQAVAAATREWPHFEPPTSCGSLTIFDVAAANSSLEHAELVRRWSAEVWSAWSEHHGSIAAFLDRALTARRVGGRS